MFLSQILPADKETTHTHTHSDADIPPPRTMHATTAAPAGPATHLDNFVLQGAGALLDLERLRGALRGGGQRLLVGAAADPRVAHHIGVLVRQIGTHMGVDRHGWERIKYTHAHKL